MSRHHADFAVQEGERSPGNAIPMPKLLRVKHLLSRLAGALDKNMESFLLRSTHGAPLTSLLGATAAVCVPAAFAIKYFTKPYPLDLIVIALVASCVVFRHYGLFSLAVAWVLDFCLKWSEIERIGRPDYWPWFLLDWLANCSEWLLVCSFAIITLEKWADLRSIKLRTDDDLALAKSFQSSLSGKSCHLQRASLCGSIHQCDAVGGDFYYFRPFGKKMLNFCLGDVMGKGISASLLMATVMSFVYEWGKQSCDPAEIAARLNRRLGRLWDGRRGWFITIFYAILDEETGVLEYCAAGQSGGYLLRDGELTELAAECDPPLGVMDPYDFCRHSLTLQSGDQILLFTDGAYEAKSATGELFEAERLGELFRQWGPQLKGEELLEHLEKCVLAHTGGVYTDDTTLLHLKYK